MKNKMSKKAMFIGKLIVVILISSAFISTESAKDNDDTIIKGKGKTAQLVLPTKVISTKVDPDSIVAEAIKDISNYKKSDQAKIQSNIEILESNKKMLLYEKQENTLIKQAIIKLKNSNSETKDINTRIDSVCVRYKNPLFGKKKCVEYTPVYTIIKDGKEIKLKEIK